MSIGTNHVFEKFVSGKSVALDATQRLVKITFKTVTDKVTKKETKRDSMCVSVPKLSLTSEQVASIHSHIVALCEEAQKKICTELVLKGAGSVADEQIEFDAIKEYLDADAEGFRLDKETVGKWFDASIAENLSVSLQMALKIENMETVSDEKKVKLSQAMARYRECYVAMAGGKKAYDADTAQKLLDKLAECANENDEIANKFAVRLEKMAVKLEELI